MRFKNIFSRDKPEVKNQALSSAPWIPFGGMSTSKERVDERSAMQTSGVYACVRVIAETIASLPLSMYVQNADGSNEKLTRHPLQNILHDEPNAEMTSFSWRETTMSHLLIWGNAYSQVIHNGAGEVVSLFPLLPNRMTVDRDDGGRIRYTYTTTDGKVVELRTPDILHIPGLGFDGLLGYSPISMARNSIGMSIAADKYGAEFFANAALPSGVLLHPLALKPETRKNLKDSWNELYGKDNGGRFSTAVLEEGMKWQALSIPNKDAQFLETRKFQIEDICRIFRVPPHMVADLDKATFSNIEHQSLEFVEHTIRPWVVRIEQAMRRVLLTDMEKRAGYYMAFNVDGLLRGDYQSRMSGYAIGRQNGWMSANDIRAMENLNPIPAEQGGDNYLINGNMIPISAAAQNQSAPGGAPGAGGGNDN